MSLRIALILQLAFLLQSFLIGGTAFAKSVDERGIESPSEPASASQSASTQKTAPKVEFTKIQDLNPQQKALNRPVRQKWAVVIGISKFADKRLNSDLAYAKTARRFYAYLTDEKGGRFRPDHVRLLTDDEATQQRINNSFGNLWLGKLAAEDDLVLVYIATRAFPTTDGGTYLYSYNTVMDNIYGTCTSLQEIMQDLRKNIKSDRIVLILESPYSGSAELATAKKNGKNFNIDLEKVMLGKGFIIMSSSRPDELSWSDLFTDNLIAALKEKDGLLPLQEAFAKAKQKTEYDSLNRMYAARKQTPLLQSDWQGNDLIIGCAAQEGDAGLPESAQSFMGAETHYLAANRALIAGELDKAVSQYELAIKADQSLSDARADYAVALSLKGDWSAAEQELRKAIAIKPDDSLYLSNYARVLDKLGNKEESRRVLEKAYVLNPKDRVILVALADKCIAAGDRTAAMKFIDQALLLYPESAAIQDRMCFLLSLDGRTDEAIACAKEALKLDSELVAARLKLGALYVLKGDLHNAVIEYQHVLSKNDNNFDAHYLLAQAFEKLKQKESAGSEYRKFLQLAPQSDVRRNSVEERLKNLGLTI